MGDLVLQLTNNDAANFQIIDGLCPGLGANFESLPAHWKGRLEEWPDITDGEENVTRIELIVAWRVENFHWRTLPNQGRPQESRRS